MLVGRGGRPAPAMPLWVPNCDRSAFWYSCKSRYLDCGIIPEQLGDACEGEPHLLMTVDEGRLQSSYYRPKKI
jgi:hypothetical protein